MCVDGFHTVLFLKVKIIPLLVSIIQTYVCGCVKIIPLGSPVSIIQTYVCGCVKIIPLGSPVSIIQTYVWMCKDHSSGFACHSDVCVWMCKDHGSWVR